MGILDPLSHVTILWSVIAATAILLGLMHLIRGALDRGSRVDLIFSATAFSFVGVAYTELQSMHAGTPDEWVFWVRWCYLPVSGMIIGLVLFVREYFGTARAWLAAALIGLRVTILGINFARENSIAFDRVDALARIPFLGDTISVVGAAKTSSWQWLGTVATILLVLYVLDASVTLWRRGTADERRRAAAIGGAVLLYALIGGLYVQLVIWRVTTLPLLITPTFGILVLAMAYELSRDALRASRLARDLRESQRRLELAAGAAELGLWEWDSRTNRVWATRQAHAIFGFGDEAVDRIEPWFGRIYPEDAVRVRPAMQSALAIGREQAVEFRICPPGHDVRWISAVGRAERSGEGRGTLMRGVIRDVTDSRRAQDESAELRRELTHAGRVSLLGQLASSLAHELSQPLGAILRNTEAAELVLRGAEPDIEELKAIVSDIHRDDRRAGDVIDRLRALLKRRQVDLQPIDLEALLQDVLSLVRGDAVSRHVAIDCAPEAALPSVAGDRVHLSQVLLNIMMNAMDAVMGLEPAGRRVSVRARRLDGSRLEVCIADSGPGIAPEHLGHIFDPFFTTKSAGMGMGLSVSRTIVEAHGGELVAGNGEAGGATFRVILPVAEGSSP